MRTTRSMTAAVAATAARDDWRQNSDLVSLVLERLCTAAEFDPAPHSEPMRARRVCKAWRAAGDALLRRLKAPAVARRAGLTDADVAALAAAAPGMLRLDLSRTNCLLLTAAAFEAVARGCPYLQHLDVTWCRDSWMAAECQGVMS